MNEETGSDDSNDKGGGKGKGTEIVVNGELHRVLDHTRSYERAVELAFPGMTTGPNSTSTVLYRRADGKKAEAAR